MFGCKISTFALVALALTMGAARAEAECKELKEFQRSEGAGKRKYVDMFSFRKNHRGDNVLLLFKDTIEKGLPPKQWLFLHRPSEDMTALCVMGRGEGFGQHDDAPQELIGGDFGEGHSPCATSTVSIKASDALRAYANRTLGNDIVLYTEGLSGPGFQFAIGPDRDWIIIQDNANSPQTSCLFDAGTDVLMRFNITIPAD
jgi:hypothetical protein